MNIDKFWICCPVCGKKLFKIDQKSYFKNIYIWCKNCKKEIILKEPKSHVVKR